MKLWREEVHSFQPTFLHHGMIRSISFDPDSRFLVWIRGRKVAVASLPSAEVTVDRGLAHAAAIAVYPASGCVFIQTGTTVGRAPVADGRLGAIDSIDMHGELYGVSPDGSALLANVRHIRTGFELVAWPSLARVLPVLHRGAIDWEARLVVTELGNIGFDGVRAAQSCSFAEGASFTVLGKGLVAEDGLGLGLKVHCIDGGWSLPLIDSSTVPGPSLSLDCRGVRVLLAEKPARFDIDIESGTLQKSTVQSSSSGNRGRGPRRRCAVSGRALASDRGSRRARGGRVLGQAPRSRRLNSPRAAERLAPNRLVS